MSTNFLQLWKPIIDRWCCAFCSFETTDGSVASTHFKKAHESGYPMAHAEHYPSLRRIATEQPATGLTIASLVREAHGNAVAKGFWDSTGGNAQMPRDVDLLLSKLMLIVTEAAEAAEVLRRWDHTEGAPRVTSPRNTETLGNELADILIRVADFAGAIRHSTGLDLQERVWQVLARNQARPKMHGKLA